MGKSSQFEKFKAKHDCGKVRFKSWFDVRKRGEQTGLRAYFCSNCKGWHLTSKQFNPQKQS